jgi:hypothetical protein
VDDCRLKVSCNYMSEESRTWNDGLLERIYSLLAILILRDLFIPTSKLAG